MWWNPEELDTNTCCYLGLMCRVFGVVISGAGDGPTAGSFRDLMKLLIQVCDAVDAPQRVINKLRLCLFDSR